MYIYSTIIQSNVPYSPGWTQLSFWGGNLEQFTIIFPEKIPEKSIIYKETVVISKYLAIVPVAISYMFLYNIWYLANWRKKWERGCRALQ